MTILYINTGTSANAGNGDSLRTAFTKINENFTYLESAVGGGGGGGGTGGTGTITLANLGDISITKNVISTTNTNQDIILNPNGTGRVRLANSTLQFDNGFTGRTNAHLLNTKVGGSVVGLGLDDANSSLRIVGDKENLGTLADFGLYTGPLNSWASKVYIDHQGNLTTQGNIRSRGNIESETYIHAAGNIQADGDVYGSYIIANYGFKFADGTTQITAVSTTTATPTRLGSIKVGNNLSVTGDGTLSAIITGTVATTSSLGVVQVGAGLQITPQGLLYVQGASGGADVITTSTVATTSSLGIVQIGAGLEITPEGILSTTGLGLGHLLVNDTTVYPDNLSKPVSFANKDILGGTTGASYITIPATDDAINDMRILSHGVMLITTEPDLANGIVIAPGIDGYGPGYVAVGASGVENTSGLFLFANTSQIDLWPNENLAQLNTGDPNVGVMDLWTTDLGYISLRPDSTATVIVTGGGIDIRTGGLRFPDGTYMTTGAATGVTSFNGSPGAITFTGSNIISQLGYTPYNGATNPNGYLTNAVLSFNGATGVVTFTASNIISQLGFTPYNSLNPAGYISGSAVVRTFNGSTGTITFTSTDIISQLGYTPYNGATNPNKYLTTASLASVSGSILPSLDKQFDLGSSTQQWRSIYVSSSTLYIGGVAVSVNGAGQLLVDGANVSTSGYDQSLNIADDVQFNKVTTTAVTFSDGSTQTTAVSQVPAAGSTQTGIVYAITSSTSTAPVSLGFNAAQNDAGSGGNTAIGYSAMCANTIGSSNTAIGCRALWRNTTGNSNVAIGNSSLTSNRTGQANVAVGVGALQANTYGSYNSAFGWSALSSNRTGYGNTAIGSMSLYFNCGDYNIAVGCVALQQNTLGYGNVALGSATLKSNTLGSTNVAIGNEALFYNTTGNSNIAVGPNVLTANTYGQYNVAMGYQAMCFNATGNNNVAIGYSALWCSTYGNHNVAIGGCAMQYFNESEGYNVAIGFESMRCATAGANNVAIGNGALYCSNGFSIENIAIGTTALYGNISGNQNVAIGSSALQSNTVGIRNIAIGYGVLQSNTSGRSNVAIGTCALRGNTTGCGNVAIGCFALMCNTTGYNNVAIGVRALGCNVQGRWNVALGDCALCSNTSGYQNVAIGLWAMRCNTTGWNNIAIGFNSLNDNRTGCDNVAIGINAGALLRSSSNVAIGANALPNNAAGGCNIAIGLSAACFSTGTYYNVVVGAQALLCNTAGSCNLALGFNAGRCITGSGNVVIGSNVGTLIQTSNCNVLISDGGGNVKAVFTGSGAVAWGNNIDFGTSGWVLQSNGPNSAPSWVTAGTLVSGIATTATNIQNGTAGQIPYQTGVSATSFFGPGTDGQILVSAGATAPTYTNTSSIQVGAATNVLGGSAGQLTYQSASGATTFLALGTAGQILTAGASAPQYSNTGTLQVGFATNVLGGSAGQVVYQSTSGATTFLSLGTQGQVLVAGATAPTYTNTSTLQVGFATNVLGGSAGAVGYQSGSGATSFITGTTGNILVSGGTSAPVFQNTLTLAGTTLSSSSSTGALVVAGGAGVGKSLYVGDTVDSQKVAVNSNASSTTTNTANALYVAGGAWIGGTAVVRGNAIFDGTVVFNSSTIYTVNQTVSTSSNFLQLHSPAGATWAFNDGKDIGIIFNYYASGDANAFLGRAVDTGYLEWYETGTDGTSVFTGTYGTFKTGNIQLVSGTSNLGNTNTGALTVAGGVGISGGLYVGGTITGSLSGTANQATNLNSGAAGSIPYQSAASTTAFLGIGSVGQVLTVSTTSLPTWSAANLITVGQSTTATNIIGGTSGQIPYQLSAGSTRFFGPGTAGQLLMSAGTNTPAYTNTSSIFVGFANNVIGGATGSIAYQSSTSTTAFLALGTNGKVLTAGASGPQWTDIGTVTAGASTTATNLAGGTAGQIPYQTGPGATGFFGTGTSGQLLVSAGTGAPTYTNTSSIQVGFATNVLGGSAGQIHYQSGSGVTAFVSGTAGQILVSGGTGAPSFANTSSIFVGYSKNVIGGAKGSIPYQTDISTTALLAIGTQGQVLTVNGTSDAPEWVSVGSLSAGIATTATNLQNGTAGQIPYQSAAGVTGFVSGTNGQIFVSGGAGTPSFISTSSIVVGNANTAIHVVGGAAGSLLYQTATNQTGRLALGSTGWLLTAGATAPQWTDPGTFSMGLATTATNLQSGTAGQIPYQTGPGATGFFGTGTSGQVLVSNGTSAPSYSSVVTNLSLATPTVTGGITYSQASATAVNTAAVTIDSFTTSTYRSVKYVVSIANTLTNEYQTTEALIVHNGTNAFIKSDSVFSGQFSLMSLSATVTAGSVVLQGTGVSNGNQVKVQRIYI
jgi:hypothetical protein